MVFLSYQIIKDEVNVLESMKLNQLKFAAWFVSEFPYWRACFQFSLICKKRAEVDLHENLWQCTKQPAFKFSQIEAKGKITFVEAWYDNSTSVQVPPDSNTIYASSFPTSLDIQNWWRAIARPRQMCVEHFLCDTVYSRKRPIFNNYGSQLPREVPLHPVQLGVDSCDQQLKKLLV
jgi:hypothetical protein